MTCQHTGRRVAGNSATAIVGWGSERDRRHRITRRGRTNGRRSGYGRGNIDSLLDKYK